MKIVIKGFLVFALALSAFPSSAKAAQSPLGTSIVDNTGTVYTITTQNGRVVKRPYTSEGAFLSYGFNYWGSVVRATTEDYYLPTGSFIPPQNGRIICADRGYEKGTCYLMSENQKAGFVSESVFYGQGHNYNRALTGDVSFLSTGVNISYGDSQHLPGTLISKNGTNYIVTRQGLLQIQDIPTFNSWGYSQSDVVPANVRDGFLSVVGVLPFKAAGQISYEDAVPSVITQPYPTNLAVTSTNLPDAYVGQSYSTVLAATGGTGPYTWRLLNTTFPSQCCSLGLNGTNGLFNTQSGTVVPSNLGSYSWNVEVTDSKGQKAVGNVYLNIKPGIVYNTGLNFPNQTLPDAIIGQSYSTKLQASGGTAPYSFRTISTTYPSGCCVLGLNGTEGVFNTQSVASVQGTAGTYTWLIELTDAYNNKVTSTITLSVKAQPSSTVTITSGQLPDAVIGSGYSTQLQVSGGTAPYKWEILSTTYPYGCCVLGLVGENGVFNTQSGSTVSGPSGYYTWTVKVSDVYGNSAIKTVGLTIKAGSTPSFSVLTSTQLPDAKVGQAYNTSISYQYNTDTTVSVVEGSVTGLPTGIGPNTIKGMTPGSDGPLKASYYLNGTPTVAGTYTVYLTLKDSSNHTSVSQFVLTVKP